MRKLEVPAPGNSKTALLPKILASQALNGAGGPCRGEAGETALKRPGFQLKPHVVTPSRSDVPATPMASKLEELY